MCDDVGRCWQSVVQESTRLLGLPWDLSPAGVQVVVNLLMVLGELMQPSSSSALYISLWDHHHSDFKALFRRQFQVGFQGGLTTWPICQACYHLLLLLLERGQQDHLVVPADAAEPLSFFGAMVFQQSRFLLTTAEDTHLVIDFLCRCLEKDDLADTLLHVGILDAFFGFFLRFKTNHHAISDIFNKHVAPTYEISAVTDVIVALKRFLDSPRGGDRYWAFTLDHMDASELLHAVICRELRRYRLRLSPPLEKLICQLQGLVQRMVEVHVAAASLVQDIMTEELLVMQTKWPKDQAEAYKVGVARSLPKAVWMDVQSTPLWQCSGVKGFDKGAEPKVFTDLSVVGVDYDTLKNELGRFYKRAVRLFGSQHSGHSNNSSLISNQEDLAKHMHKFVKAASSTEKIYVEVFVDIDEGGVVKHSQNFFDMGAAVGISSKQADLQRLLADAGNDAKKLQSNQTVEKFYDYFKTNEIEVVNEEKFSELMVSPSMGFDLSTALSAFRAFDANYDGSLSLKEIAIGFSQLSSHDPSTRLKTLFAIYDVDGNGRLDADELADLLAKATGKSLPDAHQMAKDAIARHAAEGAVTLDLLAFTQLARECNTCFSDTVQMVP